MVSMRILPNNLNYKNNLFVHNHNTVTFGEIDDGSMAPGGCFPCDNDSFYSVVPPSQKESSLIFDFIKIKNFAAALQIAKEHNFDPNYQDSEIRKPLLIELYEAKPSNLNPLNILKRNKYDILMEYIALNYRFNPNFRFYRNYPKNDFELITL